MANRRSTLRLGRLAGIPIGVQPLWLVIVGLITFTLGHDYFPAEDPGLSSGAAYLLGLASALALFAGILLHELGHAVVARGRGVEVDEIDLWLLGGVARLHGEPRRPGDELRFALAGPAVTVVPNPIAVDHWPFRTEKDDYLVWIGRMDPTKGAHRAIEVALLAGRPLVLAGPVQPGQADYFRASGSRPTSTASASASSERSPALPRSCCSRVRRPC